MGTIGTGTGAYIGTKIITSKNQQTIANNIYEYQHGNVDIAKAKKMVKIGVFIVSSPYLFLISLVLLPSYFSAPNSLSTGAAALCILLFFAWIFVSIVIAQNINRKYGFYVNLQDPEKEKMYRWQHLVLFEDEIDEWKEYIKDNLHMRPSGVVKPVVIDRNTSKILGNLQI